LQPSFDGVEAQNDPMALPQPQVQIIRFPSMAGNSSAAKDSEDAGRNKFRKFSLVARAMAVIGCDLSSASFCATVTTRAGSLVLPR
jgi:hypothetical protein